MRVIRAAVVGALLLGAVAVPAAPAQAQTGGVVLLTGPAAPVAAPRTPPAPAAPPKAAKPATPAWWQPLPARSGTGRRIVYSMRLPQHVWVVDSKGRVLRQFKASGRLDKPGAGTYRVFSKSSYGSNPYYGVTFRYMIRFTFGRSAAIGFHSIPRYYSGRLVHPLYKLGQAVGQGGCPHLAEADARWLFSWAGIGTKVVVVR